MHTRLQLLFREYGRDAQFSSVWVIFLRRRWHWQLFQRSFRSHVQIFLRKPELWAVACHKASKVQVPEFMRAHNCQLQMVQVALHKNVWNEA